MMVALDEYDLDCPVLDEIIEVTVPMMSITNPPS
jgi:hypothetical protein